ncbi:MAG TPA: DUF1737 domain-containing protein [Ferruginibacter sp.]|nr:DUF1737 domain-containing protein [Ferruginibacter sp.]HRO18709.1 DUF1737 domain-containing protein [Ferruginibacter sp.]
MRKEKIYKYELLVSNDPEQLSQKVASLMDRGFEPFGGVSATSSYSVETGQHLVTYAQAVVAYE